MQVLRTYREKLDSTRAALIQQYALLADPAARVNGGWSAREVMRHLYLSEYSSAKIFRSAERVCQRVQAFSDEMLATERETMSAYFLDRSVRVQAPERIQPGIVDDTVDVLGDLRDSRDFLLLHMAQLSDEQMRSLQFRHTLRGDCTLYGWLWFIAMHEQRHTMQLMDILHSAQQIP